MKIRSSLSIIGVFTAAFAFFHHLQFSTTNIPGFDGYYHIKLASIIREQGLLKTFPWLQFTYLKDHFVDFHFLYHLLLIPFTYGDLTYGAKMSTVVFFAIMAAVFYAVLEDRQTPAPWFWFVILLIGSPPFLYRMSLPRAPVTALALLLPATVFLAKDKRIALFSFSFLFVWMYGGFTVLLIFAGFWFLSQWAINKSIDRKTLLALVSGILAGVVINPYFPENTIFLYSQTFEAGISRVVAGGGEWRPYDKSLLVSQHHLILALSAVFLTAFVFAKRKPAPETLTWFLFLIFMVFLTLRSRRFVEYLFPALVMTCALLARDGWQKLRNKPLFDRKWVPFISAGLSILCLLWIFPHRAQLAKDEMYDERDQGRYKKAALWLKGNTPPGSTVYTSDWDDFPELFFYNSQNRYIIGLDPAFLYVYDKTLYRKWNEINLGKIKEDPYPVLLNLFRTPYLFTDNDHGPFISLMNRHPRITLRYEDGNARIYSLK